MKTNYTIRKNPKYLKTNSRAAQVATIIEKKINLTASVFWVLFKNPKKVFSPTEVQAELAKDGVSFTSSQINRAMLDLCGKKDTRFKPEFNRDEFLHLGRGRFRFNPNGTIRIKSTKDLLNTVTYNKVTKATLVGG